MKQASKPRKRMRGKVSKCGNCPVRNYKGHGSNCGLAKEIHEDSKITRTHDKLLTRKYIEEELETRNDI